MATSSAIRPAIRHDPDGRRDRGDFKRQTPRNSPRSLSPVRSWRLQAPNTPQFATIPTAGAIAATSSAKHPAIRHHPDGRRDRGDFKRHTPRDSPRSRRRLRSWRLQALYAPQFATIPTAGAIVATSSANTPQFATNPTAGAIVATSSAIRPAIRHDPDGRCDRGDFKRQTPRNSPRSRRPVRSWRLQAPYAP